MGLRLARQRQRAVKRLALGPAKLEDQGCLGQEGRGWWGVARLCPVLMVTKQDHLMKDSGWQIREGGRKDLVELRSCSCQRP